MKKKLTLFCLLTLAFCGHVSSQTDRLHLRFVMGTRIVVHVGLGAKTSAPIRPTFKPVFGIELFSQKPFFLYFHADGAIYRYLQPVSKRVEVSEKSFQYDLGLGYRMKHFTIGIGHFWERLESNGNYVWYSIPHDNKQRHPQGINLFISKALGPTDIEFHMETAYAPYFAGFLPGDGLYSVKLMHRFDKNWKSSKPDRLARNFSIDPIVGSRFFINRSNNILLSEVPPKIGVVPTIGFELRKTGFPISMVLEKDLWLSFNGGSPTRDVRAHHTNTGLGLKHTQKIKNGRKLEFTLSYILSIDSESMQANTEKYYHNRGIGMSVGYEAFSNTFIEFRNIYPLRGRQPFDARLITLGLFHHLQFN